jgi:phosphoribosylformimino-5-aminoimidazole carboxamide ribotide isomerase
VTLSACLPVEIIPVIDLRHGQVVRARAGDRDKYAPIVTPLSATSDPVDVARGLLGAVKAQRLYIADLDGIEGRGGDMASIRRIADAFPCVSLWIDAGVATEAAARAMLAENLGRLVLGSESQADTTLVRALGNDAVLSLDFRGDAFAGPDALRDDPTIWPGQIIVMTLARVGMATGPDIERLQAVRRQAPQSRIYAAGGLRGPEDLPPLAKLGITGILVASALHDGRLGADHLHPQC